MAKLPKLTSFFHKACSTPSQLSYAETAQSETDDFDTSTSSVIHETLEEDTQSYEWPNPNINVRDSDSETNPHGSI